MRGVALELAVRGGSFLERPSLGTVVGLRGRSPSVPTATSSTAVPTNAMSSLV